MNKNLKKLCFTFCAPNANPFSASSVLSYLKKILGDYNFKSSKIKRRKNGIITPL